HRAAKALSFNYVVGVLSSFERTVSLEGLRGLQILFLSNGERGMLRIPVTLDAQVRRHSWEQMRQQLATYSSPWCTGRGHAVHYATYSSLRSMERGHRTFSPNVYGSRKAASFGIDLLPHSKSACSPLAYRRFCGRVKIPWRKETRQHASWLSI